LISDSFGHEYNISEQYAFSVIGGDTKEPDQLISRIRTAIDEAKQHGIAAEDFERTRRRRIGGFLRQLNSPEAIANEFTKYQFKGIKLFDILPVYEQMTLEDVNERLRTHFDWTQMAVSIVKSERA
jgi:predicted Zn-dependent peptidase